MNEKKQPSHKPAGGLALSDIYFVVFRQKWKIIICSALGLVAALIVWIAKPMTYQSEAQLLIRYVKDAGPTGGAPGEQVRPVDSNGEGVVNTEVAILGSFNIAMEVASNIGPATILGKAGTSNDTVAAASLVRDSLNIERFPGTPVLRVIFSHHDPNLVRPILKNIIETYQTEHVRIHSQGISSFDSLVETTGNLHNDLLKIEEDLRKKMSEANIIDLDGTKKTYAGDINLINSQIIAVSDELALHQALLKRAKADPKDASTAVTNAAALLATTNVTTAAAADAATNAQPPVAQELIDEYNQSVDYIDTYKKQLIELRKQAYSAHSKLVLETQDQIKTEEAHKKQLEKDEPRLVKLSKPAAPTPSAEASAAPVADPATYEQSQVDTYQYKLQILQESLARVHASVTNLEGDESAIRDLQRNHDLKEKQYIDYLNQLNTMKANIDIGALKEANIVTSQDPTPPGLALTKTPKFMAIAALGGILAGIAWAFLTEYYFDHSIRRAKEVETDLNLRLFLSIPDMNRNGHRRNGALQLPAPSEDAPHGEAHTNGALVPTTNGANGHSKLEVAPWDSQHSLSQYYEALRDRLISYFEVNNLNHKPKLVAVTGSGQGCGTSTIAGGLAASLSETGDGNVLLVDMNIEEGAAQQFYKGKPRPELDDALAADNETRGTTMVQKNLYVVNGTTNGDQLARMLPKRFANLLPTLKASDYDYIIFDMPPVARTGVTQRLAGFMDMMLLVVEAEKTNREVVRQAGNLLSESKANVSVVLNKTRTYIPEKLHQEF
jgi:polysaccharide biosynthesis transport protein